MVQLFLVSKNLPKTKLLRNFWERKPRESSLPHVFPKKIPEGTSEVHYIFNRKLFLVKRKMWNHYFSQETKQVISCHSGRVPYHRHTQWMRISTQSQSCPYKAGPGFQGHTHIFFLHKYTLSIQSDTYN